MEFREWFRHASFGERIHSRNHLERFVREFGDSKQSDDMRERNRDEHFSSIEHCCGQRGTEQLCFSCGNNLRLGVSETIMAIWRDGSA